MEALRNLMNQENGTKSGCCAGQSGCGMSELFQLLGKAHMLDVLHILNSSAEPVRFNEIQRQLKMSPNTLSIRLKELQEAGLVNRHSHDSIPPRVDYSGTLKAQELRAVFRELGSWAKRHTLNPAQQMIEVTA